MTLPRQKIYKFDIFLLIKSILNFDFFSHNDLIQEKLEKIIARFVKVKFCTLVPRGRVGLKFILNFIKGQNSLKNEVLMSPFTIFDVVNMVISENLKPDFFDISKHDFSINLNNLKKRINKNTLALILTHYHIEPLEYDKLLITVKLKIFFLLKIGQLHSGNHKKKKN